MDSRFEIGLIRQWKLALGLLPAIAAVFALVGVVANHVLNDSWQIASCLITLLGGGFISYRVLKWWVKYEVVILMRDDGIMVQHVSDGKKITIPFARLGSYRHESSNGWQALHLNLTNGPKVKLSTHDIFGRDDDFDRLIQAIEQATVNRRNENAAAITREPGFFEKRISTILLVVITVLYALMIGKIVRDDLPIRGNMISALGAYITYLGAWLAASKRRNEAR